MWLDEGSGRQIAEALDGEYRSLEAAIVSRSRVTPWKVEVFSDPLVAGKRTRLTAFGEAQSRPLVIYRDSLPVKLRPAPLPPERADRLGRTPAGHYALSEFMVEVAPMWSAAESRAAITVTDHSAADWLVFAREHVAAGWDLRRPSLEQLRLAISTLTRLTELPKSRLPFR